jgi:dienelactone hydrolase
MKKANDDRFTVEHRRETDAYEETRFTIQSEEGYSFPVVIRVPKGSEKPLPVMLTLQGHSTGMHISLGAPQFPGDEKTIAGGDRDFVVRAVREGYVGVAIEQRNFGECGGDPETGEPDCYISAMNTILNGRTTVGERVLDTMCVIDALLKHFDCIDPTRILLMGNSGGGTTTFYTAALDERICLAMPSCAVCTYKHSIAAMHHCACNFIPGIAQYFDMGDLSGLIAPRKLILVSGRDDEIFPDEGVRETYELTEYLYAQAGAPESCFHVTGNGGHRFYADDAWPIVHGMIGTTPKKWGKNI